MCGVNRCAEDGAGPPCVSVCVCARQRAGGDGRRQHGCVALSRSVEWRRHNTPRKSMMLSAGRSNSSHGRRWLTGRRDNGAVLAEMVKVGVVSAGAGVACHRYHQKEELFT